MGDERRDIAPVLNRKLTELAAIAWEVRKAAHILGDTKVGCAVLSSRGGVFQGCNVEHQFRSHDIHAEVNAIGSMVAGGETGLVAIVVVAEREQFTPCGACMDWIFQFGGPECTVAFQGAPRGEIHRFTAAELMPYYPR